MSRLTQILEDGHHQQEDRVSPVAVVWSCSCGWRHQERRSQNALARNSKLIGAWNEHIRAARQTAAGRQ